MLSDQNMNNRLVYCTVPCPSPLISTKGALRLPTTYDNHPSIHPIRHIALNELNRPKIDVIRPPMQ